MKYVSYIFERYFVRYGILDWQGFFSIFFHILKMLFRDVGCMWEIREKMLQMTLRILAWNKSVDVDTCNQDWLRKYNKCRKMKDCKLVSPIHFILFNPFALCLIFTDSFLVETSLQLVSVALIFASCFSNHSFSVSFASATFLLSSFKDWKIRDLFWFHLLFLGIFIHSNNLTYHVQWIQTYIFRQSVFSELQIHQSTGLLYIYIYIG